MNNIKLTPFWLFLILLAILIFSLLFLKNKKEGLINFQSMVPLGNFTNIPNYNSPLFKLYDNDFFDPNTQNVIRIYGAPLGTGNNDFTGSSIDYIDVIDKTNNIKQYRPNMPIPVNHSSDYISYNAWSTYTTDPKYKYITSNQLLNVSFNNITYLHIIDILSKTHIVGYLFAPNAPPIYTKNFNKPIGIQLPRYNDINKNNNTFTIDTRSNYQKHVFQLCSTIYFDQNAKNLIIGNYLGYSDNNISNNNSFNVFDRFGNKLTNNTNNTNYNKNDNIWIEEDSLGNNIIIFVNTPQGFIIIVLQVNNYDNSTFNIVNVKRFLFDGSIQINETVKIPNPDYNMTSNVTANVSSYMTGNIIASPISRIITSSPISSIITSSPISNIFASVPITNDIPYANNVSNEKTRDLIKKFKHKYKDLLSPSTTDVVQTISKYFSPSTIDVANDAVNLANDAINNIISTNTPSPSDNNKLQIALQDLMTIVSNKNNTDKNISNMTYQSDNNLQNTLYDNVTNTSSSCNAQTIIDRMNSTINEYNALFDGINKLQKNMNKINNNNVDNAECQDDTSEYINNTNILNDVNFDYIDYLTNVNNGSDIYVNKNYIDKTGLGARIGTSNLMTGTGVGTANLMTGAGVGTSNLMTGAGEGTGNLMSGVGRGTSNLMSGVGEGTSNLMSGVGEGTGNLMTGVGTGADNLLTGVGRGTGNLMSGVGTGAENLLTGVGKGTKNLISDVGSGVENIATNIESIGTSTNIPASIIKQENIESPSGIVNTSDIFSYNGQLIDKPSSNFIPMLTDFSKFGR